ncbi:hypothetical protein [Methylobacterium tardum]|uniref:hypothetical protein n=1 Tax=Methylobacterium tardum TaxID=374432 RepID=UPI0036150AB9
MPDLVAQEATLGARSDKLILLWYGATFQDLAMERVWMGIVTWGPPQELIALLQKNFKFEAFVETGTFEGKTSLWASERFPKVYTIEASKHYYDIAQDTFSSADNIDSRFGDTSLVLSRLIPNLPPSLIFLDAHWSTGQTAGESNECPLLTELEVIRPWFSRHVVMIDDARYFLEPPIRPHRFTDWPSIGEIIQAMNGTSYTVHYKDVLLMIPRIHRIRIEEAIRDLNENHDT